MIDPPKATKGRRMSKKSPKKTRKKPARKTPGAVTRNTVRAQSDRSTKKQATKKQAAQTRPGKASKSGKKASQKSTSAGGRASQKARLKQLKSAGPTRPRQPKAAAASMLLDTSTKNHSPPETNHAPAARPSGVSEGGKAPAFHLPRDGGGTVSLSDYAGKKLVLFFYPRADTPGCTREAIDFSRLSSAFAEKQTALLGISADPPKAQEAFRDKHQLATPLLSDEQHTTLEAYGVWGEKSMYGKTFQGVLRTTMVVGPDGRILKIWRNVKVDGHAEAVLAQVQAL
jgi:thioredoxin-dependent peroxiredoxin